MMQIRLGCTWEREGRGRGRGGWGCGVRMAMGIGQIREVRGVGVDGMAEVECQVEGCMVVDRGICPESML